ncbi:UNVERIFIED_CONTAM: hypothetical protein Sindi_0409100 [Sesamum indicum]
MIGLTNQLDNDSRASNIDLKKWLEAMRSEMDSMYSNKVWTMVNTPKGVRPVECKLVYRKKLGVDGEVMTFKARLVVKGYPKTLGGFQENLFTSSHDQIH